MKNIIKHHFKEASKTIYSLKEHEKKILSVVQLLLKTNKNKRKVLIAGNGGSCSDAEHFAGELICTFDDRTRKAISALPLSSHSAAITAWANDFGFESFFKRQVEANGNKGDILFLLSTSGGDMKFKTSTNLIYAAREAKKKGLKIVSLVGKKGGELKKISDIFIHVKNYNTAFIQEAHMSILHCICTCLDKYLVKKNVRKKKN